MSGQGTVARYRAFRGNCAGWAGAPFEEFRRLLEPLLQKPQWGAADRERLERLAAAGGAYALRALYGGTKAARPQIEALLGPRGRAPHAVPRAELEAQLRILVDSCVRDGWGTRTFERFQAYLDSDEPPPLGADADADASAPSLRAEGEPDLFAEQYRAAWPGYRALVREHLAAGASCAASGRAHGARAPSGEVDARTPDSLALGAHVPAAEEAPPACGARAPQDEEAMSELLLQLKRIA